MAWIKKKINKPVTLYVAKDDWKLETSSESVLGPIANIKLLSVPVNDWEDYCNFANVLYRRH